MTKADLANEVHRENGLSMKEAFDVVELMLNTLKATLAEGEDVKIAGFGTFLVRKKGARKGRNLQTGEVIPIAPRKVVTFKPSYQFKAKVENPPL